MSCTNCGLPEVACECGFAEYNDLEYNTTISVPDEIISVVEGLYRRNRDEVDALLDDQEQYLVSGTNVRIAGVVWMTSIHTQTAKIDDNLAEVSLNDMGDLKEFVRDSADGDEKWEKAWKFWKSDIPEKVAHLWSGNPDRKDVIRGLAILAGLTEGEDTDREATYMGPAKASMVAEWLGVPHTFCIDSRRHAVLEPMLKEHLGTEPVRGATHGTRSPFRSRSTAVDVEPVAPWKKKHLHRRLRRTPDEYVAVAEHLLMALGMQCSVPTKAIPHLLFMAGTDPGAEHTFHEELRELLHKR